MQKSPFLEGELHSSKLETLCQHRAICQHIFDSWPTYSGQNLGEKLGIVYGKQILLLKIFI